MSFLFVFLILEDILEQYISILSYSDEILALAALVGIVLLNKKLLINKNEIKIILCLFGVLIIGFIGNQAWGFQKENIAIVKDIVAISKFFAVYLFSTTTFRKGIGKKTFRWITEFSRIYIIILFIFGCLSQFINTGMTSGVRNGIKSYRFLYSHETFLTSVLVIMVCILVCGDLKRNRAFIFAGACTLALTMRSKAFIFLIILAFLMVFIDKKRRGSVIEFLKKQKFKIATVSAIALLIVAAVVKDKIYMYISWGLTAARPALYIVGFRIMKDYFPIGSGFGTFASYLSGYYYSPLYSMYGISGTSGLQKAEGYTYISDTYWPYIFAQFGAIGTLLYFLAIFYVIKNCLRVCGSARGQFIAVISLLAYILYACFVESLLTNAVVISYALVLGYYTNLKTGKGEETYESK